MPSLSVLYKSLIEYRRSLIYFTMRTKLTVVYKLMSIPNETYHQRIHRLSRRLLTLTD